MTISPNTARDVLGALGVINWNTGSFTTSLVETFMKADVTNARKLSVGFPEIGEAVDLYKNVDGGYDMLLELAKS